MSRRLKVRRSFYEYRLSSGIRPRPVPLIELKGYWLEQAGFPIGKEISVFLKNSELIITAGRTGKPDR